MDSLQEEDESLFFSVLSPTRWVMTENVSGLLYEMTFLEAFYYAQFLWEMGRDHEVSEVICAMLSDMMTVSRIQRIGDRAPAVGI